MKQIVLLFLTCVTLFSLAGTTTAQAKSHRKSSANKPLSCPIDPVHKTGKRVPVQEFAINKKSKMLICIPAEMTDEDGKPKSKFLTQYDAFLFEGKKPGKRVLTGSVSTPVKFEQKKNEIYEVMHLTLRGEYHPLFEEKIVCEKGMCKRKEKKCVFNQYHLSPPSPKEIERERVIYAKGTAQVQEMTDADLAQMANLALTGRKMAYDFFTTMDRPILLGSTANFYTHMSDLLKQIKTEGCLKIQEDNKKSSSYRAAPFKKITKRI